jgi:formylglycine-generating enzyme required for sulfatase activity
MRLASLGTLGIAAVVVFVVASPVREREASAHERASCPGGMVDVEGSYCPEVEQRCVKWLDGPRHSGRLRYQPRRCAEFDKTTKCVGEPTLKHFCIDRYEYPNRPGEKPAVMRSWNDADRTCRASGKRLCADSEWTLACEGKDRLPYPYGTRRDPSACNIDKPHPDVNESALADPALRDAEVERLWQGEPSGSRTSCVSDYGVFDLTGNVDEWVVNESGHPFKSASKGGYWGPVRNRCRPTTTAHGEDFAFYQLGFRCCADL